MAESKGNDAAYKEPSKADLDILKKKHGDVYRIKVVDSDGTIRTAIIRQPNFADMQRAQASENKKPLTFNLSIWSNCKLSGDPEIDKNDQLLMGAISQISEIVKMADSSLEKL